MAPSPEAPGMMEGLALIVDGAGFASIRESNSFRNWSRESVLELKFSLVSWLTCSRRRLTFDIEASRSDSNATTRWRCCCNSPVPRSELRILSLMASSRILDVSSSPATRIFSRRSSRTSARSASSPFARSSKAAFCAWSLCISTCSSSCEVLRTSSASVSFSLRAACARALSSCAALCSSWSSALSFPRRSVEHSSRKVLTSVDKASYSAGLFAVASSTSIRAFSRRSSCSSRLTCSNSASSALLFCLAGPLLSSWP
mmetsp:Transcript_100011/g.282347  ORF Transcript_100011/g.282347 Transcript_100011/m.282347 type:complete len:258 (-) Transcript_100011:1981-2754(-)